MGQVRTWRSSGQGQGHGSKNVTFHIARRGICPHCVLRVLVFNSNFIVYFVYSLRWFDFFIQLVVVKTLQSIFSSAGWAYSIASQKLSVCMSANQGGPSRNHWTYRLVILHEIWTPVANNYPRTSRNVKSPPPWKISHETTFWTFFHLENFPGTIPSKCQLSVTAHGLLV